MKTKDKSTKEDHNIIIETEIDEKLTINDIKKDLEKCKKMIRRADDKIRLYQRKITQLQKNDIKTKNLVKKGLSFFNISKNNVEA